MNAPDTIYIHPADWMQHYVTEDGPERIPYHRRKTCVWVQDDDDHGIRWYRSPHGERAPEDQIEDWPYCRGCGGRIEITVGDVKEGG